MEIWNDIKGFEGLYKVSSYGNVKRLESLVSYKNGLICKHKEHILKKEISKEKYHRVTLSKNNKQKRFQVHRLVAMSFLFNPNEYPCVNHIDGNGFNNKLSNLEWCSYSQNETHSYFVLGKINHNRKLKETDVLDILNNCEKGVNKSKKGNVIHFMNKYNVDRKTVLNVLNQKYYV